MAVSGASGVGEVPSHTCGLLDLVVGFAVPGDRDDARLDLRPGWSSRWTATWRVAGAELVCMVRDLDSFPLAGAGPVRTFGWRAGQRHRPGLGFMVSTGRLHGFESLEEAKLLLAVDFLGMTEVLVSQPFRLRFSAGGKTVRHTPDVLVRGRAGTWLIDVRPAGRIGDGDVVKFAAAASAAESCGWKYVVVAGWRRQVLTTLDAVSSQRRDLQDPLRLQDLLLARAAAGGRRFGDLVGDCVAPAVARAQLLHLIWLRCLGIDLARPLTDDTLVICAERSV